MLSLHFGKQFQSLSNKAKLCFMGREQNGLLLIYKKRLCCGSLRMLRTASSLSTTGGAFMSGQMPMSCTVLSYKSLVLSLMEKKIKSVPERQTFINKVMHTMSVCMGIKMPSLSALKGIVFFTHSKLSHFRQIQLMCCHLIFQHILWHTFRASHRNKHHIVQTSGDKTFTYTIYL